MKGSVVLLFVFFQQLNVQAEGLQLLDQDVEGFRQAGLQRMLALFDALRAVLDSYNFV